MIRNSYKVLITINVLFFAFLAYLIIPLFFNGIVVKSQRTTGPEFIVLDGQNILQKQLNSKNVIYTALFVEDELDTKLKSFKTDKSILLGEVVGIKMLSANEAFPLVKVKTILPMDIFYGEIFLLFFIFLILMYLVYSLATQ